MYIPEAITADHKSERIYFSNYHNIETTRYDGRNRIVLTKKSQAWFFDVAIYQVLIDFSLTVKAATFIFIYGRGSAISSAKQGISNSIYNFVKNK